MIEEGIESGLYTKEVNIGRKEGHDNYQRSSNN